MNNATPSIEFLLTRALRARAALMDDNHVAALRLFNGFLEGKPDLAVDLYARTLVIHNYADQSEQANGMVSQVKELLLKELPWVQAVVVKTRNAASTEERNGKLVYGETTDRRVREGGVWYAVDLMLNADASLYLDTRNLRGWAKAHLSGKSVLNTFAYTGSLGVAARAGGARRVLQLDLNRRFLNLAKDSYLLNGFPIEKSDFITGDFWVSVNRLKRSNALFDCVFVDPPFFSVTSAGRVDLVSESHRVINKVRPLVAHQGYLVAINNALFLSGEEYLAMLKELCADGYLSIESLIPVPSDFTGYPETRIGSPPVDPSPFNHTTKIVILKVRRKDERPADV